MPFRYDIFISYSRYDSEFVDRLENDLKAYQLRVWVDRGNLQGGQDWQDTIEEAINQSRIILVVLSPQSLESKWVPKEIGYAQDANHPIIPLKLRAVKQIPMRLNGIQWIDFENRYTFGLPELLKVLSTHQGLIKKSVPSVPLTSAPSFAEPMPHSQQNPAPPKVPPAASHSIPQPHFPPPTSYSTSYVFGQPVQQPTVENIVMAKSIYSSSKPRNKRWKRIVLRTALLGLCEGVYLSIGFLFDALGNTIVSSTGKYYTSSEGISIWLFASVVIIAIACLIYLSTSILLLQMNSGTLRILWKGFQIGIVISLILTGLGMIPTILLHSDPHFHYTVGYRIAEFLELSSIFSQPICLVSVGIAFIVSRFRQKVNPMYKGIGITGLS